VSVMDTFMDGLVITGVGMGLVFLTLIIVMWCIILLDKLFKVKEEPVEETVAVAEKSVAAAVTATAKPEADTMADDEAAAIAVAIAATLAAQQPVTRITSPMVYASPFATEPDYDPDIEGEVMTVSFVDAGPGTWKNHGRLKALQ